VITFTGDAGFWYHIGVYGGQQTERGKELWTYTRQNFAKIAEDIGALGIRVEKPAEIGPALQRR